MPIAFRNIMKAREEYDLKIAPKIKDFLLGNISNAEPSRIEKLLEDMPFSAYEVLMYFDKFGQQVSSIVRMAYEPFITYCRNKVGTTVNKGN